MLVAPLKETLLFISQPSPRTLRVLAPELQEA